MEYRLLGGSGCAVSALALGALTFGNETSEADSHAQLDLFVEAGGTLVDTADVYADTRSEEIIGRWLASRPDVRDAVVLATKGRFPTDETPNGHGLSRRHLASALDASLRRLNVQTIDLYQLHSWDPLTPIMETLRFLDEAVRAGKIHYVGLSNFTGWQLQKTVDAADAHDLCRPAHPSAAVQPPGPRDRMGDRPGLPVRGSRAAGVVTVGKRLAYRKIPAQPAPARRQPGRGERRSWHEAMEPARPSRAELAGA